jgi:hypothetical protein
METIRSTDYLAAIRYAPAVGFEETDKKPGTIRGYSSATAADLALAALVFTAALVVALVVLNWSR